MKKLKLLSISLLFISCIVSAKSTYDTNGLGLHYIRVPNCVLIENAYFGPEDEDGLAPLQARCADIDDLKAGAFGIIDNFPVYVINRLPDTKSGYTRPEIAKFKLNNSKHKAGQIYSIDVNMRPSGGPNSLEDVFYYIEKEKTGWMYNTKIWGHQTDYTFEEYVKAYPLSVNSNKLQDYLSKRFATESVHKAIAFSKKRIGL